MRALRLAVGIVGLLLLSCCLQESTVSQDANNPALNPIYDRSMSLNDLIAVDHEKSKKQEIAAFDRYLQQSQRNERFKLLSDFVSVGIGAAATGAAVYSGGTLIPLASAAGIGVLTDKVKDNYFNDLYQHKQLINLSTLMHDLESARGKSVLNPQAQEWYLKEFKISPTPFRDESFQKLLASDTKAALARNAIFTEQIFINLISAQFESSKKTAELQKEIDRAKTLMQQWQQEQTKTVQKIVATQKQQAKQIRELQTLVKKNSEQIENDKQNILRNRAAIETNSKDIRFLQDLMWGRISPTEQRLALRNGFFPEMSKEDRKIYDLKLSIVERQEQLVKDASQILNGANSIITIAEKLGFDPELIKGARLAAGLGNVGVGIFKAALTGGLTAWLEVGNLVGSLFGGDPTAQILEEIRKLRVEVEDSKREIVGDITALSTQLLETKEALRLGQRQISEQLRQLADVQAETLKTMHEVHSSLHQMDNQNYLRHSELIKFMNNILDSTYIAREILQFENSKELIAVKSFLEKRWDPAFGFNGISFPSYEQQRIFFGSNHANTDFNHAYEALRNFLHRSPFDSEFNPSLYFVATQKFDDVTESKDDFVRKVYSPMFRYFAASESRRALFHSLLHPSSNLDGLDWKLNSWNVLAQAQNEKINVDDLDRSLRIVLSPHAVLELTDMVIQIAPYFELIDDSQVPIQRLQTIDDLTSRKKPTNKVGYDFLKKSLDMVNVTIAQQSLLSGDALIPVMARDFSTGLTLEKIQEQEVQIARLAAIIDAKKTHLEEIDALVKSAHEEYDRLADEVKRVKEAQDKTLHQLSKAENEHRKYLLEKIRNEKPQLSVIDREAEAEKEMADNPPTNITRLRGIRDKLSISFNYATIESKIQNSKVGQMRSRQEKVQAVLKADQDQINELTTRTAKFQDDLKKYRAESDLANTDLQIRNQDSRFKRFLTAIRHNPYLQHNFMVYLLGKDLMRKRINLFTYHAARTLDHDDYLLKRATDLPLDFVFTDSKNATLQKPAGWSVRLAQDTFVSLPTATDVADRILKKPPILEDLLRMRSKLVHTIMDYEIPKQVGKIQDSSKREQATKLMLGKE